jgi:type II secretory pathway component GspD/PulD (secretin)
MGRLRALLIVCLAAGVTAAAAQDGQIRVVRLNFGEAAAIAGLLGGIAPGRAQPDPAIFVQDTIIDATRRLPDAAGRWFQNAAGRSYPSGAAALVPPEGLTQPPVAIVQQNAILLRGSTDALDQTEEIIRLLDKPQPMVNIDLRMVDDPTERVQQWGIDFQAIGPNVQAGTVGNAPPTGLQVLWGMGDVAALGGVDLRRGRGRNVVGANVTTFNNTPATVSFGQVLPFFISHVTYDWWGNRHVDTEANAIFTGIEFWVLPRINADDSVTLRLIPTITDAVGAVTAPDGSSLPITKTVMTDVNVRVPDGQSLVIGGMERSADDATQRFRSLLGETQITRATHPVLLVTPHVIRPQN